MLLLPLIQVKMSAVKKPVITGCIIQFSVKTSEEINFEGAGQSLQMWSSVSPVFPVYYSLLWLSEGELCYLTALHCPLVVVQVADELVGQQEGTKPPRESVQPLGAGPRPAGLWTAGPFLRVFGNG